MKNCITKRVLSVFIVVLMLITLVGCGGGNTPAESNTDSSPTPTAQSPSDSAATSEGPVNLAFGASSATSPLYAYYSSLSKGIMREHPNFNITIQETGGSVDNAKRMRDGLVQIASVGIQNTLESYYGTGTFEGEPREDTRLLWFDQLGIFVWAATQDSGIKTIWDFDGKYMSPGGVGTSIALVTKEMFDHLGIKPTYLEGNQSVAGDAFQNKQIVGIAKLGPQPDSFLMQMKTVQPLTFINLSDDDVAKFQEVYPFMEKQTVAANVYDDNPAFQSVGTLGGVDATSALPQDIGYILIKSLLEDCWEDWVAAYPQGADVPIIEYTLKSTTPLHAGTVQYMVEKGIDVPAELIPPEYVPVS